MMIDVTNQAWVFLTLNLHKKPSNPEKNAKQDICLNYAIVLH